MTGPSVVAIGGGHGLATTVRAVRGYAGRLDAIVMTGDDGGSSGRLRDALDVAAPGDLRRCLTTLAGDRRMAAAFEHRFSGGELDGHAVGNLVLAGLVDSGYSLGEAVGAVADVLGVVDATVWPATEVPVTLVGQGPGGVVRGQVAIERADGAIDRVATEPADPPVPTGALDAIAAADQVVLGPGSFLTSVVSPVALPAVRARLATTSATVVWIANLSRDRGVAAELTVLGAHGVDVDVVVVPRGSAPDGQLARPVVVEVDVPAGGGSAHDPERLGAVLASVGGHRVS